MSPGLSHLIGPENTDLFYKHQARTSQLCRSQYIGDKYMPFPILFSPLTL